jgi:hypothetical protein
LVGKPGIQKECHDDDERNDDEEAKNHSDHDDNLLSFWSSVST